MELNLISKNFSDKKKLRRRNVILVNLLHMNVTHIYQFNNESIYMAMINFRNEIQLR